MGGFVSAQINISFQTTLSGTKKAPIKEPSYQSQLRLSLVNYY
ncbi:hypothetical protein M565_ctg5P0224 [Vibrio cyclitrophicus FF75]|nr:hypothetical protein M565_ctg5P0224 [Vibrio cyclitrophicus FF75]